jgi:hypothetical protein
VDYFINVRFHDDEDNYDDVYYEDYENDEYDEDYDSDVSDNDNLYFNNQRQGILKYTNITPLGLHNLAKHCPKLHEIKQNETVLCRRLSDIFVPPYSSVMDQHVERDSNSE